MITLYRANETNFEHNGLGRLDNELKLAEVEEEINALYSCTLKYPISGKFGHVITNQMIVKAPTPGGDQLFRIYQCEPSMGTLTIIALHIFYDLAFNFIEDINIISKTGQNFLQQLSNGTQYRHPFTFFSDNTTVSGSRIVRKNCVEILLNSKLDNSFVSRYGGEILRDNFKVYFNRSIGRNRNYRITYRKNLKGYKAKIDDKAVITRIMPIGFDGLILPEKYVDSPRINDYPFPRIGKLKVDVKAAVGEFANDEDALPLNQAYEKMRQLVREQFGTIDTPITSYEVDFIELSKTKEFEKFQFLEAVQMGDTVVVDHEDDNFHATSRIIKYKYDSLRKRFNGLELGNFESRSTDNNINQKRTYEQKLEELSQETANMIQVAANKKNAIYRGEERPENANIGDLWYQPNGQDVILKQWSGTDWEVTSFGGENFGNININDLSGNAIDIKQFRLSGNGQDILFVGQDGKVVMNIDELTINAQDVATKADLAEIELTPGPKGADGRTPHLHIAYATSADGSQGFSTTNSVGKTYIGQYTDYTEADSIDRTRYAWTLIKGEKGNDGPIGPQGPPGEKGALDEEQLDDINTKIDNKADQALTQEQINALNEQAEIVKAELEAKATVETLNKWIAMYEQFVADNEAGKKTSEEAMRTLSQRIVAVTNNLKEKAERWNFLDKYFTVAEEGIVFGKQDASSAIKISDDRISMFSAGQEVMFISQGVLHIDNGIFSTSVQIGRFREQQHPVNLDMNVMLYIG